MDRAPFWLPVAPDPFPAAAAMAAALLGKRRRRRPMALGRSYRAATWWHTSSGRAAGIAYLHLPPPQQAGGALISTGAEFEVLATADGLYTRSRAPRLTPHQLETARAAIHRITTPETLAAWAAAEVQGYPSPCCVACGRPLLDATSRAHGLGPDCWGHLVDAIKGSAAARAASHLTLTPSN